MKLYKRILSFVFIACALSSCKAQGDYPLMDFNAYEPIDPISKTEEDQLFIGHPQGMCLINGWLAIDDMYDGKCITWVSPDLKTYIHNVDRGTGPGEIVSSAIPFPTENPKIVKIQDFAVGKFYTFTWDNVMKDNFKRPLQTDQIGEDRHRAVPVGKNYVCHEMTDTDEKMFSLIDPKGKVLSRFGDYPPLMELTKEEDPFLRQVMSNCKVSAKTDGSVMVAAGFCSDYLAFFRINGTEVSPLKQYNTFAADRDIVETASGHSFRNNSRTIIAYGGLCPSDKYFFALYSGIKAISDGPRPAYSYLQVFDWDGNFVKGFKLNDRIAAIAFDDSTQTLYGLAGGDFHISTFKLTGL